MVVIERKPSLIEGSQRIPTMTTITDLNEASTSMPNRDEILVAFEEVLVIFKFYGIIFKGLLYSLFVAI